METYKKNKEILKNLALYVKYCRYESNKSIEALNEKGVTGKTLEMECKGEKKWFHFVPSHEYRIRHIAMSEFRGKKREEIENPRQQNLLSVKDEEFITDLKNKLSKEKEEFLSQKEETPMT